MKNKLDSVMARLDRLCSLDGDDGVSRDEDEHERRAMLFKLVVEIISTRCHADFPPVLSGQ